MAKRVKCTPENLASVVNGIVGEYLDEVAKDTNEAVKKTGEMCRKLVKAYAQSSGINGSKYFNSFRKTTLKDSKYLTTVAIHSSKYSLAHLLENGHMVVYHGHPTGGRTRAFPHFAPAEKKAIKELEEEIVMRIKA